HPVSGRFARRVAHRRRRRSPGRPLNAAPGAEPMRRMRPAGFTLVEVIVAMSLLATIMVLLYSGLTFALRSWDAGDANGRKVADRRLGENFLRRELTELFP